MLVQHPQVKHWLIVGMNDNTVLGGVRATEGQGFKAPDVIGIGINGVDAVNELSKAQPTGFYGSAAKPGYPRLQNQRNAIQLGHQGRRAAEVHGGDRCGADYRDNFKEELAKKGCNSLIKLAPPRRGAECRRAESLCNSLPLISHFAASP